MSKRYALWNNKGGVGKSFLTFSLATEYAASNPDKVVAVVDLCPQANVTEILLGGNREGAEQTANLIEEERTIGGYFDMRIPNFGDKIGTEIDYFIKASDYNDYIPDNLHLVAGDSSLELQVPTINSLSVLTRPSGAWAKVHGWVSDLMDVFGERYIEKEVVFFMDCNPSFALYTQQAIFAATNLIVPCSPDGSSARAIRNVFHLVYGHGMPEEYIEGGFFDKMKNHKKRLPIFDMVIFNKSTIYSKKPANAFQAMRNQIKNEVQLAYGSKDNSSYFSTDDISDIFCDMPDAHSVAVVSSAEGIPLRGLRNAPYKYDLMSEDESTQITKKALDGYKKEMAKIVAKL